MSKLYACVLLIFAACGSVLAQPCTTTNGAGCDCPDGSSNCVLLPDLTISWYSILHGSTEYSQTGNGANDGQLRVTGTTPNMGYGPFTVRGTDYFLCGTDTIYDPSHNISTCPDGSSPKNLLKQRIYSKNGNTITYTDRWAGGQTYHPSHGHNHVDDWVSFTLRIQDVNEPDPRNWPIVGSGAKIGFCLMDLSNCVNSSNDCRTDQSVYGQGTVLNQASQFPNYGMGGGQYSCSPVEQGISSGYADIYDQGLDGMFIEIPPGTCNGNYWIVAQVDPLNNFLESDETNNWTALPWTLTEQVPAGNATAEIDVAGSLELCNNASVVLTASPASSYLWSTGDTTASITVAGAGSYSVFVNSICGSDTSDAVVISNITSEIISFQGDSTCLNTAATISAAGTGVVKWYDSPNGGNLVATGNNISIPLLGSTTVLYAESTVSNAAPPVHLGPIAHAGSDYSGGTNYNGTVEFDALMDFTLQTVKVYTGFAGIRTIELRNANGTVLYHTTLNIDTGTTIIPLNFAVTAGNGYELGTSEVQNQITFSAAAPFLKRSDSGVNYPYTLAGVAELTGNSIGSSFYYYFYDWVVQAGSSSCTSPRVAVTAVAISDPNVAVTGLAAGYLDTVSAVAIAGQPAGGTFSGTGVVVNGSNVTFNPAIAGPGVHEVIYSYTDSYGCDNTVRYNVTVTQYTPGVGMADIAAATGLKVYPNPAQNQLTLEFSSAAEFGVKMQVLNIVGSEVMAADLAISKGITSYTLDVSKIASGMYWIEAVTPAGMLARVKVIKQ